MKEPNQRLLAVIPARGGSTELPGKNIRPLAGLPLIAHSILFARLCPEIDRVIVSTDSPEIAEVARAFNGDVPFLRPAEYAQNDSPMWPVLRHALQEIETSERTSYDYLLLLDPTSPCRLLEDISDAFRLLVQNPEADGVIGVSRPESNPLWNCWRIQEGWMTPVSEESGKYRYRQEVPEVYRINASLYIWRASYVRERITTWRGGKMIPYEIPDFRVIHIDELPQFERAEILIKAGYIRLPWLREQPVGE